MKISLAGHSLRFPPVKAVGSKTFLFPADITYAYLQVLAASPVFRFCEEVTANITEET